MRWLILFFLYIKIITFTQLYAPDKTLYQLSENYLSAFSAGGKSYYTISNFLIYDNNRISISFNEIYSLVYCGSNIYFTSKSEQSALYKIE